MDAVTAARTMAVVLTHDRPASLARAIRAVIQGTVRPGRVLVVDNASSRPARDVLAEAGLLHPSVEILRLPENTGPAGGYAAGLRAFLHSGLEAAWVMDDDCAPRAGCLAVLLARAAEGDGPTVLFPTGVDQRGRTGSPPAWMGVLLPREIVAEVGLPNEDLFWWIEDTEYLHWRVRRAGFATARVREALIDRPRDEGPKPAWKFYYEARNTVYYRTRINRRRRLRRLLGRLPRIATRILLREDQRWRKLRLFVRGVRDGFGGRLGRRVPTGEADR